MFTREQASETLQRHLMELDVTLKELQEYGDLGWFPSERHRLVYALAQDLRLIG